MKKYTALFLILALLFCLAGCRGNKPADTTAATQPTQTEAPTDSGQTTAPGGTAANGSARILSAVWDKYGENDRFAVYGGMMDAPVDSAPGDLDLTVADEITSKYLIPTDQLAQVEEGASLVHLMNSNLFTAAAFRLKTGTDTEAFAKALRENIQKNQWICGQPDRLLIAQPEGDYLLVAFGSEDAMKTFGDNFVQVYENARIYFNEAVVA